MGVLENVDIKVYDAPKYTVRFHANGGTGTMDDQTIRIDESIALNANMFEMEGSLFDEWSTEIDGSGTNYRDGESVKNLTKVENDTVPLYAIWAKEYYYKAREVYDGSKCDDTNISLYSLENKDRDYEISFEIESNGTSNANQSTLMNSMYEVNPWPGVLFRVVSNNSQYEFDINGGSKSYNKRYNSSDIKKVLYKRVNGKIYVSINDGALTEATDHSTISSFDTPVTFGCSLTSSNEPQRWYRGTLKNMEVILF